MPAIQKLYKSVDRSKIAFAFAAIPTTLILDTNGHTVQRIEGMANYDTHDFRQYLVSLSNTHL